MTTTDEFRAGDPWPDSAWWNATKAEIRRGSLASAAGGLGLAGGSLTREDTPEMWAEIAGGSNPYGFMEAVPTGTSGRFALLRGGRSDGMGLRPAYEANGVTGLAGTYQRLRWTSAGDWRFQDISAGGASSGRTDLIIIPACFCPVPSSLTMTSADPNCNYGMFQSCTIQYQDPPACFAPIGLTSKAFLSTTTFTDRIANAQFYYFLFCQYNLFSLTRLYCKSPYGSPFRDGVLYSWLIGGYGNTCDPFALTNGQAYPGSDASCGVTIS